MLKIGNVLLKNKVIAAPLAGISNPVYRKMCHDYGASLCVSEMISDKALHYQNRKTQDMCAVLEQEHPVSLQLFGADTETMGEASAYLSTHTTCDIIDINMGCPVTKVIKAHAGSDLLRNPDLAIAIAKSVVEHTDRPVTVKMRAGWDQAHINCVEIAKGLEAVGVSAIAIHGRTKNQMYEGQVNLEYIKMVKEAVNIPVIGNGDIRSVEDAKRMLKETGCDAIMVGRGLLGRPFFIQELVAGLEGKAYEEPNYQTRIMLAKQYAKELCDYEGEYPGIHMMRSMGTWYIAGLPHSAKYKNKLSQVESLEEFNGLLDTYQTLLNSLEDDGR
ncbi:MAG: tRNA dihydrouridine synthase DusB [Solobacterium sp.]|nr:tRNA dihydrouridine synthase DusB [Solobacterium sp.]